MKDAPIPNKGSVATESESLLDKTVKNTVSNAVESTSEVLSGLFVGKVLCIDGENIKVELLGENKTIETTLTLCSITKEAVNSLCVIQFIKNNPSQPVIMGLVNSTQESVLSNLSGIVKISEDDERITLNLQKDVMIRCGKSQLYLRKDGVIQMKGDYIDLQAKATQTIKGGSVRIN